MQSADNVLFLEEADESAENNIGYIVDSSNLPGGDRVPARSLKQVDDSNDSRCVLTVFEGKKILTYHKAGNQDMHDPSTLFIGISESRHCVLLTLL